MRRLPKVLHHCQFFAARDDFGGARVRRTKENSPARQRWEWVKDTGSPGTGRKSFYSGASFAPFRGWSIGYGAPRLTPWAMLFRPLRACCFGRGPAALWGSQSWLPPAFSRRSAVTGSRFGLRPVRPLTPRPLKPCRVATPLCQLATFRKACVTSTTAALVYVRWLVLSRHPVGAVDDDKLERRLLFFDSQSQRLFYGMYQRGSRIGDRTLVGLVCKP